MTESSGARGRAVRGIEAAAFVLHNAVDAFAIAGGEGARRLGAALGQLRAQGGGPAQLEGEGLAAAQAAVGHAAAGKRTALIASGEALIEALPALREMARLGLPVLVVVPSHGPDIGQALPAHGFADLAHLASFPTGVLLASDAAQVADFMLAALRAAADRGAPWVVGFELHTVGLALANAHLPTAEQVKQWIGSLPTSPPESPVLGAPNEDLARYRRDVERFSFAIGAAMRDVERTLRHPSAPLITDGLRDAEIVIIATGASARAARHAVPHMHQRTGRHVGAMQIASMAPFPAADVVRHAWRARAVLVHEAFPHPLGVGGALSDAVRASFADALTWHPAFAGIGRIPPVVTVLGADVSPEQWLALVHEIGDAADPPRMLAAGAARAGGTAEARVEIAMGESEREEALRLVVDWLARTGTTVAAHAHEPTRAGLAVARSGEAKGPSNVLVVAPGANMDPARLESLPAGSVVVLAGDFPDRVLADTMRAGAARGIRVATLHAAGGTTLTGIAAVAAVMRTMVAADAASDAAFEATVREHGGRDGEAMLSQVRNLADALRAQFS